MPDPIVCYFVGGPRHGAILEMPKAPQHIDLPDRTYRAVHVDPDNRTVIYIDNGRPDGPEPDTGN